MSILNVNKLAPIGSGSTITVAAGIASYTGKINCAEFDNNPSFTGNVTIAGNLGVAGTITYEDVARVDATGISTFREGYQVGPLTGIALTAYKDGSIRTTGIITASSFVGDGSGLTGINTAFGNSSVNSTGIITATALVPTTGQLSHRNLVMNGQFDIWQRGTDSGSQTASGYFSADRWKSNDSGGTYQITRQAFTVGQTDVPSNPKYYMRFAVTTGNNNVSLGQRIEGVDKVQGQVTLSFWAKGTNPNGGTFDIINRQDFGSGGSVSSVVDTSVGSFSVTASWVKKTFTFTPPSISGKTLGTTHSGFYECQIFRQPAGDSGTAAYTIDIANVQLEFGPVATPFEQRSYGDELARCQRYFYAITGDEYDLPGIPTYANNATTARAMVQVPVPMRTAPSYTGSATSMKVDSSDDSSSFNCNNLAISQPGTGNPCGFVLQYDAGGMTAGQAGMLEFTANSGYMHFSAEL